jgi:chaperonin GroES
MAINTVGDRIIVERAAPITVTKGGILIPEVAQNELDSGKVLAVGPDSHVQVGSTAYFSKFSGDKIKIDGKEYTSLNQNQIAAFTTEDA